MRSRTVLLLLCACAIATVYLAVRGRDGATAGRAAARQAPIGEPEPEPPAPAQAPGSEPEPAPTPAAEPEEPPPPAPLDAPPSGALTGIVRSSSGVPAVDAAVRITPLDGSAPVIDARPDAQGFVRVDGLPPGPYRLEATHPRLAPRSFRFDVAEGRGAGPFDIVLVEGGALRVRVVGLHGAPVMGQQVRVALEDRGRPAGGRTDASGEFLFEHLAPGSYWVRRNRADGATDEVRTATVEPGKTVEVIFEFSCGLAGTISGPDGRPLADAIVSLVPATFGPEGYRNVQTRSGEGGGFELQGFPAGAYRPRVQVLPRREEGRVVETGYVASLPVIEFAPGEVRTEHLRVSPNVLSGRITRAATGQPLGGQDVQISAHALAIEEGKAPVRTGDDHMAWADEEGRFRFVGLPAGHYEVWVFALRDRALAPLRRTIDFTSGGARDGVDLALLPRTLGRVRLKVLEPDGTAATGLFFGLAIDDGMSLSLDPREAGDGLFEFLLETGARKISVYRKGMRPAEVEVEVSEGSVAERELRLQQAGE